MEVPEEWERAIRELSPISRVVPWLAVRWFPMRREVEGAWQDCGRWLVSECVPEERIPEIDRDIITILQGPKPSSLPMPLRSVVLSMVNDYQWRMYRAHRVWARELWIVQGSQGGHATHYTQEERNVLQLLGLPLNPPAVGELPYAPIDGRVLRALTARNRLLALGNDLDALKRSARPEAVRAEEAEAGRDYRRRLLDFLEAQQADRVAMLETFTKRSENRGAIREATAAERNAAARLRDEYIATGEIPRVVYPY